MYSSRISKKKPHNQPPNLGAGRTQQQKNKQSNPVFSKKKKNGGAKAPKQQHRGTQPNIQRQQHHTLSPLNRMLVPTVLRSGDAFAYLGMRRHNFVQKTTDFTAIFVTNTGTSGSVMTMLTLDGITSTVSKQVFTIPTLASADDAGGPTSGRAMKAGLTVLNTTQLLNRGGRVYTLNSNQRIRLTGTPSAFSLNDHIALQASITGFPSTHEHDGAEFGRPAELTSTVVDHPSFETFNEWSGTQSVDDFFAHIAVWPGSNPQPRPMSTIIVYMSPPAVDQTYTLTARGTFYTRWPLETIVGQAQTAIPTAASSAINSIHTIADRVASKGLSFAEDAAMTVGAAALFTA